MQAEPFEAIPCAKNAHNGRPSLHYDGILSGGELHNLRLGDCNKGNRSSNTVREEKERHMFVIGEE
jgi:hypothetical protein